MSFGGTQETKNEEEVWYASISLLHQPGSDPKGQTGLLRSFRRENASWATPLQALALCLGQEATFSHCQAEPWEGPAALSQD